MMKKGGKRSLKFPLLRSSQLSLESSKSKARNMGLNGSIGNFKTLKMGPRLVLDRYPKTPYRSAAKKSPKIRSQTGRVGSGALFVIWS